MATTAESARSLSVLAGAPSARSLATSFALHVLALIVLVLVPASLLRRPSPPRPETRVVFHRPKPRVEVPALPLPAPRAAIAASPRPGRIEPPSPVIPPEPRPLAPGDPVVPETPVLAEVAEQPQQKKGKPGLLAFRDQIASASQDKIAPRLGAEARYGDADDVRRGSSRSMLTANAPGSSGVDLASMSRTVRGGGGAGGIDGAGGGGSGDGGLGGVQVGKATSAIAGIGGGDRPLSNGGPGPSRTDEEIQIVFDRYKASFYRLYNRELRNDPTLQGQMVLRLTIEPDGSVSMCKLQSSDMNAPALAEQVVNRVLTINFGAKEGVSALTIVYPIDFLPAA